MAEFKVVSPFEPQGDQPQAIDTLANGVLSGDKLQVLLGVTGSGKTFTMAKLIERVQKPTLVIAHNKTLAAQLCSEFREFFPNNAGFAVDRLCSGHSLFLSNQNMRHKKVFGLSSSIEYFIKSNFALLFL